MKKILAIVLALAMVFTLAACGGSKSNTATQSSGSTAPGSSSSGSASGSSSGSSSSGSGVEGTYDISVWTAEAAMDLTAKQIKDFNDSNELGIVINATINPKSEADAGTDMITDIEAGPDLYCFAQDQFARLVQAGALAKLGERASQVVAESNSEFTVQCASAGNQLYAYPLTSDNGYFLFYDKSVIPDADVDSLEKLIADCEAAKKYFAFEVQSSAWYIASWFFGTGCVSEWTTDEDGQFVSINDTFDSPEGLIAVKGMYKLVSSPFHLSSSQAAEFDAGAAVLVSGNWATADVKAILGDNMGVTDLPSFEVDGKQYHLGSFSGCKLMGVKPQTDAKKGAVLHLLAQYLTSYDCQMERFEDETLQWGPTNLEALSSDAVKKAPGLAALAKQGAYAKPQNQIHGSWWDYGKVIGEEVKNSDGSDAQLQAALDNYKAKIDSIFAMSDEQKRAFTVIGGINGTMWDTDFAMTEVSSGVWKSNEKFELHAGEELKCRQGLSWDVSFGNGGDNFVVDKDGTYTVVLTLSGDSGNVTLE